jgi:site-specific recombinase XerD
VNIKGFLKSIEGLAENTRKAYEQSLWQLNSVIAGREPTNDEIYSFLTKYNSTSLHRHKAAIKAYLEFTHPGEAWPFSRRQFAGRRHRIPRYVPVEVVYQLIDAAENKEERMFVQTLFTLGCRIKELRGIQSEDISQAGVRVLTKGGMYRLKRITKDFYPVISKYAKGKKGLLFPHPYSYYNKTLRKLSAKVGHSNITPHMLRHARAVDLLKKGMPLPFVQQFLGHVNINTTAIYLEITGGELGDVLEKVEANGTKVS